MDCSRVNSGNKNESSETKWSITMKIEGMQITVNKEKEEKEKLREIKTVVEEEVVQVSLVHKIVVLLDI